MEWYEQTCAALISLTHTQPKINDPLNDTASALSMFFVFFFLLFFVCAHVSCYAGCQANIMKMFIFKYFVLLIFVFRYDELVVFCCSGQPEEFIKFYDVRIIFISCPWRWHGVNRGKDTHSWHSCNGFVTIFTLFSNDRSAIRIECILCI